MTTTFHWSCSNSNALQLGDAAPALHFKVSLARGQILAFAELILILQLDAETAQLSCQVSC